ncbi:MAG: hypothetical protein QOH02_1331, partial [Gaiellaceae bacterium]|nr:hypothetical protein [Gaiellaceae bacterium]
MFANARMGGFVSGRRVTIDGRGLTAAVLLSLLVVGTAGGASRPRGALLQLGKKRGCVYSPSTAGTQGSSLARLCARGVALETPLSVAVSPDGRNVYVAAAGADAVSAFSRAPKDGGLQQLQGANACVTSDSADGRCKHGRALSGVSALVLSRDGRSVYALAPHIGVAVLARNSKSGALAQLPGTNGCVGDADTEGDCVVVPAMDDPSGVAISPDGRNVYVTSASTNSVAVFARDAKSGRLTQLPGEAGCMFEPSSDPQDAGPPQACRNAVALQAPAATTVSADGKNVYVAGEDMVAVFARNSSDGSLAQLPGSSGCVASADLINPDLPDALPCVAARSL